MEPAISLQHRQPQPRKFNHEGKVCIKRSLGNSDVAVEKKPVSPACFRVNAKPRVVRLCRLDWQSRYKCHETDSFYQRVCGLGSYILRNFHSKIQQTPPSPVGVREDSLPFLTAVVRGRLALRFYVNRGDRRRSSRQSQRESPARWRPLNRLRRGRFVLVWATGPDSAGERQQSNFQ